MPATTDTKQHRSGGVGFLGLLALVFITLKLCGVIDWSWWWVLAPLWIPAVLALAVLLFCLVIYLIVVAFTPKKGSVVVFAPKKGR